MPVEANGGGKLGARLTFSDAAASAKKLVQNLLMKPLPCIECSVNLARSLSTVGPSRSG